MTLQTRRRRRHSPRPNLLLPLINLSVISLASLLILLSPVSVDAVGTLFAHTNAEKCAEDLPYGPATDWDYLEPYLCTDCMTTPHRVWEQILTAHGNPVAKISWAFLDLKTIPDRIAAAVATGEIVRWTVRPYAVNPGDPPPPPRVVIGVWRWSTASGGFPGKFSDTTGFSANNGCWAAGVYVDGNFEREEDNNHYGSWYGHCNFESTDLDSDGIYRAPEEVIGRTYPGSSSCDVLWEGGVRSSVPSLESYMYAHGIPTLVAATDAYACAENLDYGARAAGPNVHKPGRGWDGFSPYFCEDCDQRQHTMWEQIFYDEDKERFRIFWDFVRPKTMKERFDDAVTTGEEVVWTILPADGRAPAVMRGVWRWSTGSYGYPGHLQEFFSPDDGCWAAGSYVDGNVYNKEHVETFWGQCNLASRRDHKPNRGRAYCAELFEGGNRITSPEIRSRLYSYGSVEQFTQFPQFQPSAGPSGVPSNRPTKAPSGIPIKLPSSNPSSSTYPTSKDPTSYPTLGPSKLPSEIPNSSPSLIPSTYPSTNLPSITPTKTNDPSVKPSSIPSSKPSASPTKPITLAPTTQITESPSFSPSSYPSLGPSKTNYPSKEPIPSPTESPTIIPSYIPSNRPTILPSYKPSKSHIPSTLPTDTPTSDPTIFPSPLPSKSNAPSVSPSETNHPSLVPSVAHTNSATLLLITDAMECAQDLPYGPNVDRPFVDGTDKMAPYFCTDCGEHRSRIWTQSFFIKGQLHFMLHWFFNEAKTTQERIDHATNVGEEVVWTVVPQGTFVEEGGDTITYTGVWRWSSASGGFPTAGVNLSMDDGCWAAGEYVDGNYISAADMNTYDTWWGQCNLSSLDTKDGPPLILGGSSYAGPAECDVLWEQGVRSHQPTLRTEMIAEMNRPEMFAATSSTKCASTLPHGGREEFSDNLPWDGTMPYFCTDCALGYSNRWEQVFYNATQELFRIVWNFEEEPRTVVQRFLNAMEKGEKVVWTILPGNQERARSIRGVWRWSSNSTEFLNPSGVGLSSTGCWAASEVSDGSIVTDSYSWYGQCNRGSEIGCSILFQNGDGTMVPSLRSEIYSYGRGFAPEEPSSKPSDSPSLGPTISREPTLKPTRIPTIFPSHFPTKTQNPSVIPSVKPTMSKPPTSLPSSFPSSIMPSKSPSTRPSWKKERIPSSYPSISPSSYSPTAFIQVDASELIAITSATHCAQDLPYGPQKTWDHDSPYFCTDCIQEPTRIWDQYVFVAPTKLRFRITWVFPTPRRLRDRFDLAAAEGERVTWTIHPGKTRSTPLVDPLVIDGTWRWSSSSGGWPGHNGRAGNDFSKDDGCWAGGRYVDGNYISYADHNLYNTWWGQCNLNSVDAKKSQISLRRKLWYYKGPTECDVLYENGHTSIQPDLQTYLFAHYNRPTFLAVTNSTECAVSLSISKQVTDASFFCTDCVAWENSLWEQIFYDGETELFRMLWDFDTPKTLKQRFDDATRMGEDGSTQGEMVSWTILFPDTSQSSRVIHGRWHFSNSQSNKGGWPRENSEFLVNSDLGGCWAAGVVVDPEGDESLILYGHCHRVSEEDCKYLYMNGEKIVVDNLRTEIKVHWRKWDVEGPTVKVTPSPTHSPTITKRPSTLPSVQPSSMEPLVAITSGKQCADSLKLQTAKLWDQEEEAFCIDCVQFVNSNWEQTFYDGDIELFRMLWTFESPKTLEQRFNDATEMGNDGSTQGELVSWTILFPDPLEDPLVIRGIWHFSSSTSDQGGWPKSNDAFFVDDPSLGGCWAAGAVVDPKGDESQIQYGHCHRAAENDCSFLYIDGKRHVVKNLRTELRINREIRTMTPTSTPTIGPQPVALTSGDQCAEDLLMFKAKFWNEETIGFCKNCVTFEHLVWEQVFYDSGTELFRMLWYFETPKTFQQRFTHATTMGDDGLTLGEYVSWKIIFPDLREPLIIRGRWHFSDATSTRGHWPRKNDEYFVEEPGLGGCWAAGAVVDPKGDESQILFGQCNRESEDDCSHLYMDGEKRYVENIQTLLMVHPRDSTLDPTFTPTSGPTITKPPSMVPSVMPTLAPFNAVLVSKTNATMCAQDLPYGSARLWDKISPYFCTNCVEAPHKVWEQHFYAGDLFRFKLLWYFQHEKTLQEHISGAVNEGEKVVWTVVTKETDIVAHRVFPGTWRWSTSSGGYPLSPSGQGLSVDDGCWAGGAYVDGNYIAYSDYNVYATWWGQCNLNSVDRSMPFFFLQNGRYSSYAGNAQCDILFENGLRTRYPDLISSLYVHTAPTLVAVTNAEECVAALTSGLSTDFTGEEPFLCIDCMQVESTMWEQVFYDGEVEKFRIIYDFFETGSMSMMEIFEYAARSDGLPVMWTVIYDGGQISIKGVWHFPSLTNLSGGGGCWAAGHIVDPSNIKSTDWWGHCNLTEELDCKTLYENGERTVVKNLRTYLYAYKSV